VLHASEIFKRNATGRVEFSTYPLNIIVILCLRTGTKKEIFVPSLNVGLQSINVLLNSFDMHFLRLNLGYCQNE
jgi:hypothetical protein